MCSVLSHVVQVWSWSHGPGACTEELEEVEAGREGEGEGGERREEIQCYRPLLTTIMNKPFWVLKHISKHCNGTSITSG